MNAFQLRSHFFAIKNYSVTLAMMNDVFFSGDNKQFAKVLKHIELENSDKEFLRQLEDVYENQDGEGLGYLLLAENQKNAKTFWTLMAGIENFAEVYPKIRNAYMGALAAIYVNELNKEEFFGNLIDVVSKLRIYENYEFWDEFSQQVSARLGVEINLISQNNMQQGDWFVELYKTLVSCKYILVSLSMLEHAFYEGSEAQFEAWNAQLRVFYHHDELVDALKDLFDNSSLDEDNDEFKYTEELTNLFSSMAIETANVFFNKCESNTKRLETLGEADLVDLQRIVADVFADMVYDLHLQKFDVYGRMAKLLNLWCNCIDADFVREICNNVPSDKEYLFLATLRKVTNSSGGRVELSDLLTEFVQSQKPDCN